MDLKILVQAPIVGHPVVVKLFFFWSFSAMAIFLTTFLSFSGKEFWGKYASMFGSSGDSGKSAAPGSWSNSSPQSSGAGSASPSWAAPSGGAFQGGAGTPGAGGSSLPSFMGQGKLLSQFRHF